MYGQETTQAEPTILLVCGGVVCSCVLMCCDWSPLNLVFGYLAYSKEGPANPNGLIIGAKL